MPPEGKDASNQLEGKLAQFVMSKNQNKYDQDPRFLYAELNEKKLKSELEVLDRFLMFSAELVRLSLLGIAVFGFLFKEVFLVQDSHETVIIFASLSVIFFALSTASS